MYWCWPETEMEITETILTITSKSLGREVTCTVLVPDAGYMAGAPNLLLLNDGQELENLKLADTLQQLYSNNRIEPVIVAAIHANEDRLMEYGTALQADFKGRGAKAADYTQFIIDELIPAIKQDTGITEFKSTAFAGFSLGGLSALDIAWHHAEVFNKVGVFSGSLWWRSKDLAKGYTDADRIMHNIVRNTEPKPDLKFWLQTGTQDETADRNKNHIIDSIDDTIDLIKELEAKGYTRPSDIQYVELVGGKHDVTTWGGAMGKFLVWAFGG